MSSLDFMAALAAVTGKPASAFFGSDALAAIAQDESGAYSIVHWDSSLGATPTISEIVDAAQSPPPPTKAELAAYANAKQWALATGGHTVEIVGVSHWFATDVDSMTLMNGKVSRLSQPNPPASFNWQLDSGFLSIPAAEFVVAATDCADFIQATFDVLFPMLAEIAAGTITTIAQIDAAAWPVA